MDSNKSRDFDWTRPLAEVKMTDQDKEQVRQQLLSRMQSAGKPKRRRLTTVRQWWKGAGVSAATILIIGGGIVALHDAHGSGRRLQGSIASSTKPTGTGTAFSAANKAANTTANANSASLAINDTQTASVSGVHFTKVQMTSDQNGWAVKPSKAAFQETILRTTDGGVSWERVTPPTLHIANSYMGYNLVTDFIDSQHAVIAATGKQSNGLYMTQVFATADGGKTWSKSVLRQTVKFSGASQAFGQIPETLDFVSDQTGYLTLAIDDGGGEVFPRGGLWQTVDGGKTWRLVSKVNHQGPGQGPLNQLPDVNSSSTSKWVSFSNQQLGFTLGQRASQTDPLSARSTTLYRTTSEGSEWSKVPIPIHVPSDAASVIMSRPVFVGRKIILAVGAGNKFEVFQSTDNGQTWSMISSSQLNTNVTSLQMGFIDGTTGWCLLNGHLYMTTDGGQSIHEAMNGMNMSPPQSFVQNVNFVSAAIGYANTSNGLYRTADGGATWSLVPVQAVGQTTTQTIK